jgi:hypothetical protein
MTLHITPDALAAALTARASAIQRGDWDTAAQCSLKIESYPRHMTTEQVAEATLIACRTEAGRLLQS